MSAADDARARIAWENPTNLSSPQSTAAQIAHALADRDRTFYGGQYVELLRVAKLAEESGEAMQALIAYHHANPRKPAGSLDDVIKELCDVALTAKVAIENFGRDAEEELALRERAVLGRLRMAGRNGAAAS